MAREILLGREIEFPAISENPKSIWIKIVNVAKIKFHSGDFTGERINKKRPQKNEWAKVRN